MHFHIAQQQRWSDHRRRHPGIRGPKRRERRSRKAGLLALHEIKSRGIVADRLDVADGAERQAREQAYLMVLERLAEQALEDGKPAIAGSICAGRSWQTPCEKVCTDC